MQKLGGKRKMDKFNFYSEYTDLSKYLSSRQFKKLVIALSKYATDKSFPDKLPKKTLIVFMKIKNINRNFIFHTNLKSR